MGFTLTLFGFRSVFREGAWCHAPPPLLTLPYSKKELRLISDSNTPDSFNGFVVDTPLLKFLATPLFCFIFLARESDVGITHTKIRVLTRLVVALVFQSR